jgi:hypothetical protein
MYLQRIVPSRICAEETRVMHLITLLITLRHHIVEDHHLVASKRLEGQGFGIGTQKVLIAYLQ